MRSADWKLTPIIVKRTMVNGESHNCVPLTSSSPFLITWRTNITTHTRMRPGQTIPSISPPQFSHPFRRYRLTLAEDTIRLGAPRLERSSRLSLFHVSVEALGPRWWYSVPEFFCDITGKGQSLY
ncbi:hypothetical protein CDAR_219031 [Caerostris darwini]|uniref:Uncharacterized protein n=1 Tax=Caerostris darwini TaxID=1538125 RepID=A0AAV4VPE7_9ARAC|nr:hypothetical protein CDAR_219031 [Caerostris darwini]